MASSMTGFGRFESQDENAKIMVELRSVNHRYLDLNLKINHRLLAFENKIRKAIREKIGRGKVDVSISYQPISQNGTDILYNKELALIYFDRISKIANDFNLVNDISASRLANMKDVLSMDEVQIDEDETWKLLNETLENALFEFVSHRNEEGKRLKEDLLDKLKKMSKLVNIIEEKSPEIVEEYKSKLQSKIRDLIDDKEVEAQRLAMEVVIYADKICVDEEIVRLKSHIESFKETLESKGDIGRKLDFITQEMNRESNTILSKTMNAYISDIGIELKTLIEKIREQVQNIE